MNRKTVGGATLLIAGGFIGRETLVWAFSKALDAASSGVRNGISFAGLSWQNGAATALILVGIALVTWPKPKQVARSTNDVYALISLSDNIRRRVRQHRSAEWFERDRLEPIQDIARAALAANLTFNKAGFVTPNLDFEYAEQVAVGAEAYFSFLHQLLEHGHKNEAKSLSQSASQQASEIGSRFVPRTWFLRG